MRGYHSYYLNDVQREMGILFHIAFSIRDDFSNTEQFVYWFLRSKAVKGIEGWHPHWLGGSSGVEWYLEILDDAGITYTKVEFDRMEYIPDDAYWCGWIIAYYQWLNGIQFKEILKPGIITELFSRYNPLHEADEHVAVDVLDMLLNRTTEGKDDPFGEEWVPPWVTEE